MKTRHAVSPKRILLISYYFPPMGMGGTQRIAGFARYLPEFGWRPTVLTVKEVLYHAYDPSLLETVADVEILRTGSLDPLRIAQLATQWRRRAGETSQRPSMRPGVSSALARVANWFLVPDNKRLWLPFARAALRRLLRREPFDAVLTSGPPHSVHLLGKWLRRKFGLPWIADFRDGWAGGDFQPEPTALHRFLNRRLERDILRHADAVVAVSRGLQQQLKQREPLIRAEVIPNGFDPEDFAGGQPPESDCFTLVHSGTIGNFVDPQLFLQAFKKFIEEGNLSPRQVRVRFVGADLHGQLQQRVQNLQLAPWVIVEGYQPHRIAISALQKANLLLYLITGRPHPGFIPGKTFEYLASRRPVLAVAPEIEGVEILKRHTIVRHVAPDNFDGMVLALKTYYVEFRKGKTPRAQSNIEKFSRKSLTSDLCRLLDEVLGGANS